MCTCVCMGGCVFVYSIRACVHLRACELTFPQCWPVWAITGGINGLITLNRESLIISAQSCHHHATPNQLYCLHTHRHTQLQLTCVCACVCVCVHQKKQKCQDLNSVVSVFSLFFFFPRHINSFLNHFCKFLTSFFFSSSPYPPFILLTERHLADSAAISLRDTHQTHTQRQCTSTTIRQTSKSDMKLNRASFSS